MPVTTEIAAVQSRTMASMRTRRGLSSAIGRSADDHTQRLPRDQDTERPGDDREQHALGERQPNESRTARAESHANGELAAPRPCAHEQQVRDIRARDEQEHANGREQNFDGPDFTRREKILRTHGPRASIVAEAALTASQVRVVLAIAWSSRVAVFSRDAGAQEAEGSAAISKRGGKPHVGRGIRQLIERSRVIGMVRPAGITPMIVYASPSYSVS